MLEAGTAAPLREELETWAFFSSADQYGIDGSRLTFNPSGIAMGRRCVLQAARAAAC